MDVDWLTPPPRMPVASEGLLRDLKDEKALAGHCDCGWGSTPRCKWDVTTCLQTSAVSWLH